MQKGLTKISLHTQVLVKFLHTRVKHSKEGSCLSQRVKLRAIQIETARRKYMKCRDSAAEKAVLCNIT